MPSFTETTAVLEIAGGSTTFIPPRFSPASARLRIAPGSTSFSVGGATSLSVTTPELDRLTAFDRIEGETEQQFMRRVNIWQTTMTRIEEAFEALSTQVGDNSTIIARLLAAEAVAAAANDNATEAVSQISITNSYVDPTSVLTASNAGVVTIAAHDRVYGDGSIISVNSGSVSGFTQGDYVTVYYDDAGRAGGAVTYYGTTNAVAQAGARHVVGAATIPASGSPDTTGVSAPAPGYVTDGKLSIYLPF